MMFSLHKTKVKELFIKKKKTGRNRRNGRKQNVISKLLIENLCLWGAFFCLFGLFSLEQGDGICWTVSG